MNNEEAKEYATKMSYTDAIYNLLKAKGVPYRKATFMKINELLAKKALEERKDDMLDKIRAEILQVVNQEQSHDERWAFGLRYAVNIIDKYRTESKE